MPITIDETYRSREGTEGDQPSAELRFVIQGTDDDSIVRSLLLAYSPRDYLGLSRTGVTFEPLGGEIWEGTAQYSKQEAQFTFDTGGGTQHISQSPNSTMFSSLVFRSNRFQHLPRRHRYPRSRSTNHFPNRR